MYCDIGDDQGESVIVKLNRIRKFYLEIIVKMIITILNVYLTI